MASAKKAKKQQFGKATFQIVPSTSYDFVEELEKDMKTDDLYENPNKFDHLVKLLDKDISSNRASKDSVN
jgi:hypothetical protein